MTKQSSIALLLEHNVTVGIGIEEAWSARNTRFDIGWVRSSVVFARNTLTDTQAALEAGGQITKAQAIALGSTNVEKLLGGQVEPEDAHEMVVTEGGDLLDFESKVIAIISPRRKVVDLLRD